MSKWIQDQWPKTTLKWWWSFPSLGNCQPQANLFTSATQKFHEELELGGVGTWLPCTAGPSVTQKGNGGARAQTQFVPQANVAAPGIQFPLCTMQRGAWAEALVTRHSTLICLFTRMGLEMQWNRQFSLKSVGLNFLLKCLSHTWYLRELCPCMLGGEGVWGGNKGKPVKAVPLTHTLF